MEEKWGNFLDLNHLIPATTHLYAYQLNRYICRHEGLREVGSDFGEAALQSLPLHLSVRRFLQVGPKCPALGKGQKAEKPTMAVFGLTHLKRIPREHIISKIDWTVMFFVPLIWRLPILLEKRDV